jgi:hypothetical protein
MAINVRVLIGLITALVVGIFTGLAIVDQALFASVDISKDSLVMSVLTVAVGGFIGAYSAFWLKSSNEDKRQHERQINALNKAIFIQIRQITAIHNIKKNFANYKEEGVRAMLLPALQPPDYSELKQDLDSLGFLINSGNPHLLMSLSLDQHRFEQMIEAISIRNDFYLKEVNPAILANGLYGIKFDALEVESVLGSPLYNCAVSNARVMYEYVNISENALIKTYKSLLLLSKELYPKAKFIRLKIKQD